MDLFKDYFQNGTLESLSKEHGLIKRKRKLSGRLILESLLFGRDWCQSSQSLNEMSLDMLEQHQLMVSLQAIDKKLGSSCESFLKALFEKLLSQLLKQQRTPSDLGAIKKFLVKDSTRIVTSSIPGQAPSLSVGLQTQIDLLQGSIEVGVKTGSFNDQRESIDDWDSFESDCLYVRDLGYVSGQYMQRIEQAGGYYMNRLPVRTRLYEKRKNGFKRITYKVLRRRVSREGIIDKVFYLGEEKYPSRVILEAVPREVKEKRIRKVTKYNQAHGHQTSQDYKQRCGFNFWVTNLPFEQYNTSTIKSLYHLRWQIELIFKTWKSILGMSSLGNCKITRVMCQLYSRLILALIHWSCCKALQPLCTVSFYKVAKIMMRTKQLLRKLLFDNKPDWLTMWEVLNDRVFSVECKKGKLVAQNVFNAVVSHEKNNLLHT